MVGKNGHLRICAACATAAQAGAKAPAPAPVALGSLGRGTSWESGAYLTHDSMTLNLDFFDGF